MLDTHQHFWDPARGDYGWLTPGLTALYRRFLPEDLAPLMAQAGVTRTIIVQAAETEAETDYLLEIARHTPSVAGVVGWLDMLDGDFSARLTHYQQQPKWLGLRPMLQEHDPDLIAHAQFRAALAEVARRDVPFDILVFPRHLRAFRDALQDAPDLRGIVDHIAKPDMARGTLEPWADEMSALSQHPRLMCKISGMVTEAGADWSADRIRPFLRHAAQAFGADRLVFGSDWPVCTLAASYSEVVTLAQNLLGEIFSGDALHGIFERNALKFYKIEN